MIPLVQFHSVFAPICPAYAGMILFFCIGNIYTLYLSHVCGGDLAYEAKQKQRRMETNMRAQREEVQLLVEGGADSEDITIERCKYQAQLDEYKSFCKTFD